MPKLSKRVVEAIRRDHAGGRDVFVWDAGDGALKGFGVRMKPSGAASYIIQYRTAEGRTRRLAIGKLGTLTPEEARTLARDKLAAAAKGADPSAERHSARAAMTVAQLCDLYLAGAEGRVKASTLMMDKSRIERHVKPLLGQRAVRSLTTEDIERMQLDIAAGRTARKRPEGRGGATTGGKGVAARTIGMFGTILEFARRRRLIAANPARGIARLPEGRQLRFLNLDEIGQLGAAMRAAEAEGFENRTGLAAIRFLLLTGVRRNEALALPWGWIDVRGRCIRFADSKAGAQLRPIGTAAVALLKSLPHAEGAPFVFPGDRGGGHFVGLPRVLARLCTCAKLGGVTIHVLRHSFAAAVAEMGFSELTIAGLLGHSVPGVTARYAHVPDRALLAAADQVSRRIDAALAGETGADVIDFDPQQARAEGESASQPGEAPKGVRCATRRQNHRTIKEFPDVAPV
jgi:integrase